jgi:hypothetical protein
MLSTPGESQGSRGAKLLLVTGAALIVGGNLAGGLRIVGRWAAKRVRVLSAVPMRSKAALGRYGLSRVTCAAGTVGTAEFVRRSRRIPRIAGSGASPPIVLSR